MDRTAFLTVLLILLLTLLSSNQQTSAQIQWSKYIANPVLGASLSKGEAVIQSFVMEDQGLFRMWYTRMDNTWQRTIGEAISYDGIKWYDLVGVPVLKAGASGSFDEIGVAKPCVIRDKEGYKMYYTGQGSSINKIGMATSVDGHTWVRCSDNPVLEPGATGVWDDHGVWAPMVLYEHHTYKMWYQGFDGTYANIGYATSSDGVHWTKYSGNPVLVHGSYGEFDFLTIGEPNVVHEKGGYHLFYTSSDINLYNKIGYAFSHDGIKWMKYEKNPIILPGEYGSWDGKLVAAPSVIFKDRKFHMWYTGCLSGYSRDIGYATSSYNPPLIDGKRRFFLESSQDKIEFANISPNPFNPSTTIQFNVAEAGTIKIIVYDINGREVKILFSRNIDPGSYTIFWDGSNSRGESVASGTYFCRGELLIDGEVISTNMKKMNLIK